jgi:hypothetical protein
MFAKKVNWSRKARMKRRILSITLLTGLGFTLAMTAMSWSLEGDRGSATLNAKAAPKPAPKSTQNKSASLSLEQKQFPQGMLYVLTVPAQSDFRVRPGISNVLATVDAPVWQNTSSGKKPVFIVNGGFFDPNNSLTTSFVSLKGSLVGDPRLNPQLVNNPKLVPYLPKIFNRPEFRSYLCQDQGNRVETRYDIALHSEPIPDHCLLQSSLGAGPSLLPRLGDYAQGFVDYNAQGKLTRDPIGVCARNARTVVGLTADGDVILMMGAQSPQNPKSSGFSLPEMASLLKARGAQKAMALDGGSSSSLFYGGKATYGKVNKEGGWVRRPVKSVLMVLPQ